MYLSGNFLIALRFPLTSSLSSNNGLIWAQGWKTSSSQPLVLHLTSWNLHIHHNCISLYLFLTHPCPFSCFTVQSHATQLTALCEDAVMWATLLVSYFHFPLFLSWRRWGWGGEGRMLLFRYLWRVMHLSNLGSGRATTFIVKNILNTPTHLPSPNEKRTFLNLQNWFLCGSLACPMLSIWCQMI